MNEIITVHNVRGYVDEQGTAWLNVEDVARGLGFVEAKKFSASGENYVRWERINGYLAEYDYPPVKAGDFIPENISYLLAMKANNEAAKKFQLKIANEILPTIRRTGSYSIRAKVPTPVADIISDVGATADTIQKFFAVKRGIALSQAIDTVGRFKNFSLDNLKQLLPPADHETGYLNASQIGEKLGLGKGTNAGRKANILLEYSAFQYKDGRDWRLTEEGAVYGEEMPYTRNGHSGYQIRWNDSVLAALRGQLQ